MNNNIARLKNLIYTIIVVSNEVDENGKPLPRKSFSKSHLSILKLKKLIEKDFLYLQEDGTKFVKDSELVPDKQIIQTQINNNPIDFTPFIPAIRYYYDLLEEVPTDDYDLLSELLTIINIQE
jgi:hypothetical protein